MKKAQKKNLEGNDCLNLDDVLDDVTNRLRSFEVIIEFKKKNYKYLHRLII